VPVTEQPAPALVLVDKPPGWTSHDVVGRIRRLAATRKVGHGGTLDPMATGLLVVGIGRATRMLGYLAGHDKDYTASVRLGVSTLTDDAEGDVLAVKDAAAIADDEVASAFAARVGDQEQVPSSVSAVKVEGRRAYQRVRSGEDVLLAPRRVHIARIDIVGLRRAPGSEGRTLVDVDIEVSCSSGTYVRALARDVGAGLGVGGHLTALRRTRIGAFAVGQAHTLDELSGDLTTVPMAVAARAAFPVLELDAEAAADVRVGRALPLELLPADRASGPLALFDPAGDLLALYEIRDGALRAAAVFVG
jgi:tRNA pseudouridine55 synthase